MCFSNAINHIPPEKVSRARRALMPQHLEINPSISHTKIWVEYVTGDRIHICIYLCVHSSGVCSLNQSHGRACGCGGFRLNLSLNGSEFAASEF